MSAKRYRRITTLLALCAILAGASSSTPARTIYVDDDAAGQGDGSSWVSAFPYLQDALAVAKSGDEIRVAQGVYLPDRGGGNTAGDRNATFQVPDGVTIQGGFGGVGAPDPTLRDIARFATVLTGDLAGNDDSNEETRLLDNSAHVVTAKKVSKVSSGAILDGLTITRGYNYASGGNGLRNLEASLMVRDCTFLDNRTGDGHGGGISNGTGYLRLENCRFLHNYGGEGAGALYNWQGSAEVINCEFIGNHGGEGAGAIESHESSAVFFHCLFRGNSAYDGTAGIDSVGTLRLLYCTFTDNHAQEHTGALSIGGSAVVAHCLFCRNRAEDTGAIYIGSTAVRLEQCTFYANVSTDEGVGAVYCRRASSSGGSTLPAGSFQARGCIFWANGVWHENEDDEGELMTGYAHQIGGDPDGATLEYCCIEGWTPERGGTGNLGADPLFVAPDQNDFHLKSQAGRWDAAALAWVADDVTSPCIDAGDPNSSVGQEPFPNGGQVNLGVYGGTCEASKSWFGAEPGPGVEAADLNGDGRVDAEDYRLATLRWPQAGQ
jgi:hypothetical protein